jgi:hypothetical protein
MTSAVFHLVDLNMQTGQVFHTPPDGTLQVWHGPSSDWQAVETIIRVERGWNIYLANRHAPDSHLSVPNIRWMLENYPLRWC